MEYHPHAYQSWATDFILSHPVSAVFLQMGLGKSVITLTALKQLLMTGESRRILVVAPLRVARDTWPEELRKWDHLSGLQCAVAVGTEKQRREALSRDAEITVINRENLPWLISGFPFRWDTVVLDELSSFKSWQSRRFKALLAVRPKIRRIIGLTGTPTSGGLMDLYAEFRLLDQGERLGKSITRYRDQYFLPDKRSWQQVFTWKLRPGSEDAIYDRIRDITFSMKSVDFLKMPSLVMNTVKVKLSPEEQKRYETLAEQLLLSLPEGELVDGKNAAVLCGKLSQMANGAIYTESGAVAALHSRKLDALEDLIEGANGQPLLVAYWYRHDLDRIRSSFPEARPLVSSEDFADWNAGKVPLALIHPASAGHGLNLQAGGSALVWFGLTWSLELYQQTNARLWRQGQQADTVVIHHIVTEDTIDEAILQALSRKETTQDALMAAVRAELGRVRAA